ncbi:MAG TPA: tetratricopeptide repeat protein, partial [Pyrinomonadaceae bacterium]|nr:tetratricopeptide repeat protein [Pyrinomonadaceae bacterium]
MAAKTIKLDSRAKRYAAIAACIAALVFAFFVVKWTLGNAASTRADLPEIAQLTTQLAPDDPQTHYATAVLLEKQFDIASLDAAVMEYEKAAALSPSNYLYWLALGTARERNGDPTGGERALRKALELAPNYSRVLWALGNLLVRQGRIDEGFAEIRQAVANDGSFSDVAAVTAWRLLGGEVPAVRKALGDSERLNASLSMLLANENRLDEALSVWNGLTPESKRGSLVDAGAKLAQKVLEAKRYRDALKLRIELGLESTQAGVITNGGFEEPIKTQIIGIFDWQITAGEPQIAPTSGQKHSGNVSLALIFNSTNSSDFRTLSQTVAVGPGQEYDFEAFYRADLKTKVGFTWEIVDAANNTVITSTEATAPSADWTRLQTRFRVS